MRRTVAVTIVLALACGLGTPAASADEPAVNLDHTVDIRHVGDAYLVTAVCRAQADPGAPTQVAVDTLVVCSVNTAVRRQVAPGGDAAVVVRAAVVPPITVCASGEADFVDPVNGDLVAVAAGPMCETHPG